MLAGRHPAAGDVGIFFFFFLLFISTQLRATPLLRYNTFERKNARTPENIERTTKAPFR